MILQKNSLKVVISINTILLQTKINRLLDILRCSGKVLVAYSGGVDSSLLTAAAQRALGDNVLAVTAVSETITKNEIQRAKELTSMLKIEHLLIKTDELGYPPFLENGIERCYHCKYLRLSKLTELACQKGMVVAEGSNIDDANHYRPGMKAVRSLNVISPLMEAGLNKNEVRQISKMWLLPTWNDPAQSCLATRIPYGENITIERLQLIAKAEDFLKNLGFVNVRVRHHGDIARIEVNLNQLNELVNNGKHISHQLVKMGFTYVTVDLNGFTSGSMDKKQLLGKDGLECTKNN